ncbi:hypothetical protein EV426DRAFT_365340 [Tirmania nivea]|nr:hypothetical protein EV426DRAFT_365340 [Tirmania nivea]
MSEKVDPENSVGSATPTNGQRFKRHCARRWWCWLISFIIFVIVVVIVVIYGIIPPVAQKALDNTTLDVESIHILQPEEDKFQFSVTSYITGTSKMAHKATIDPMEVEFYLKDQNPFMYLPLPGMHGGDKILVEKVNHMTEITDQKTLGNFAQILVESENFDMGIWGKTKIHLGSIKANVQYREWVNLKGLNKLNGMVIYKYNLTSSSDYAIVGSVVIPNPTVFTLQVGDVLLDLSLNNTRIGNGILPNLIITPGLKNVYEFKANLTMGNTLKLAKAVASGVPMQVQTTDVQYKGQSIPWLAAPLSAVQINVPINTSYVL